MADKVSTTTAGEAVPEDVRKLAEEWFFMSRVDPSLTDTRDLLTQAIMADRKARAIDVAPAAEPVATHEHAWIVGNGDGDRWRTWESGIPEWTDDREKATRFARRVDAENVHREDEDVWRVTPYKDLPNDADEAYEIGKSDGYEEAVQDIDLATGGDGEYKGSTFPGETVDVPVMKARIIERLHPPAAPAADRNADMVLVPRKATEHMVEEARMSLPGPSDLCDADLEDIYETMLAAAPQGAALQEPTREEIRNELARRQDAGVDARVPLSPPAWAASLSDDDLRAALAERKP